MDSAAEPLNTAWAARPFLHGPEREKVVEALLSGNWGNGPTTQEFEARLADFLGVRTWWRSPRARWRSNSPCWQREWARGTKWSSPP